MGVSKYFKRVAKYILRGVPNVHITAEICQIHYGQTLSKKNILITGGGRGLGYAIAKKCIAEGARVLITGRNEDNLKVASKELGENCSYISFNVSDVESIDGFMDEAIKLMGYIDCLVNNAGISLHERNITEVSIDNFEKQIDINLKGSYFMAQSFIKKRNPKVDNTIVFISSERGHQCDDLPYGLSKAAINSLTKGLSKRFYKEKIRVNAVAPGVTASDMTAIKSDGNLFAEEQVSSRYFLPEEVAEVTVFLLSDASKCISGEVIACDAGQYISSYWR